MSRLLLGPGEEFRVASFNRKGNGVWYGIIVGRGIVVIDIVNEFGYLAICCNQFKLVTSALGCHSTQFEVSPLKVSFVLVGLCNQTVVEESFHESSGMLIVVNSKVNQNNSR